VTGETEDLFDGPAVVIILANRLVSLRDDTELVVLDAIVGQHENVSGDEGGNEGDEEEKTIKYDTDGLITSGLDAPGHRRGVYDQSPRGVGFGWGGHFDEVDSQGVRGKSIEDSITVGITVEVVVEIVDIELDRRGLSIHDVELPLSVVVLLEGRRDVRISAEPVEFSSSEETGDSTGLSYGKSACTILAAKLAAADQSRSGTFSHRTLDASRITSSQLTTTWFPFQKNFLSLNADFGMVVASSQSVQSV
jgi:hypothetical protein